MPHRCVKCGKIIEVGSKEILDGCNECHGHFFFYIREDSISSLKETEKTIIEFNEVEKRKIEEDVRSILKVDDEEQPVVLDIESIHVLGPGKFEIDIVGLLNRKPIIFKLEEGKYIIDWAKDL